MNKLFEYTALTASGEEIKGTFEGTTASFEKMAIHKKLLITDIKEIKRKLDKSNFNDTDFLAFIEELYYLVKAGISIDQSIKMLIQTSSKEQTQSILMNILMDLKEGTQLSKAMEQSFKSEHIEIDSLAISFISTAEEVGDLAGGLNQLFEYLSFQKKIKSEVRQALSYPLFLMGMSVVVALLIFFIIIPKFAEIFSPEEFEKLPPLSYAVLSSGQFLNAHIFEFFTLFAIIIGGVIFFVKRIGIPWLKVLHTIPKVSNIIVSMQLSIVYGALSTMLIGGLEIDRALNNFKKVKLLPELQDLLSSALSEIKKGQKLSTVFSISQIIPKSDIALLYVGESSATLPEIFKSLSTRHSDSFQNEVKKFLAILEPAVIVFLGIFIAIIVVAIMMAVMSMTDIAG